MDVHIVHTVIKNRDSMRIFNGPAVKIPSLHSCHIPQSTEWVYRVTGVTAEARMNVPGRAEGNWSWRCSEEMMSAAAFDSLRELTKSSNRLGPLRRYGKLEETL